MGRPSFLTAPGGSVTFDFDALGLFGNPFTVSAMVETRAVNGYGEILQALPPIGFGLRTAEHGHYSVSAGGTGQWNTVTSAAKSLRLGTFQNVTVTCEGLDIVIYLDGIESGRGQLQDIPKAGNTIVLGGMGRKNPSGEGPVDASNSRLARIAVFDSVLSPEQIATLAGGQEIPVK